MLQVIWIAVAGGRSSSGGKAVSKADDGFLGVSEGDEQEQQQKRQQALHRNRVQVTGRRSMIEVRGLRKSIRNGSRVVEILRGIDLVIPQGQFVAIMGASGSG